jgi:hypothetical protein
LKAFLDPALRAFGSAMNMRTLMSFAGPAGVSVRYADTIIHPRQCQDFVTVGRCSDAQCPRRHDSTAPVDPAKVEAYINQMMPIVAYVGARTQEELARI